MVNYNRKPNLNRKRGILVMKKRRIELINFAVGLPQKMKYDDNKEMNTGICKENVEESLLSREGFHGDGVANLDHHGGIDRAVCLYSYEHYSFWEQEFSVSLPSSAFGENLTVTNMLEKDVSIGDVYQLGDAIIQITQGRIPCSTITKRTNIQPLLTRIIETGYTGYFFRVLEKGTVKKDAKITLMEPHPQQVSILFSNQIYFHRQQDVEGIKKVLEVKELANEWRRKLTERLKKLEKI